MIKDYLIEKKWIMLDKLDKLYEDLLWYLAKYRIISIEHFLREFYKDRKHLGCPDYPNCFDEYEETNCRRG